MVPYHKCKNSNQWCSNTAVDLFLSWWIERCEVPASWPHKFDAVLRIRVDSRTNVWMKGAGLFFSRRNGSSGHNASKWPTICWTRKSCRRGPRVPFHMNNYGNEHSVWGIELVIFNSSSWVRYCPLLLLVKYRACFWWSRHERWSADRIQPNLEVTIRFLRCGTAKYTMSSFTRDTAGWLRLGLILDCEEPNGQEAVPSTMWYTSNPTRKDIC